MHRRGEKLFTRMWEGLSSIDGVKLFGPEPGNERTPTVAFTVRGRTSRDVAVSLAERGVFVSHGDFYAKTVVERLGVASEGLVRAGAAVYTTSDEVERLIEGVRATS
jgi:selenocysteine lyase/cysteine desulfurase